MKSSFLRVLRAHLAPRPRCTPGPVWTWCDWSSEEGLLPCVCTCTCEDQAHCKRLAPASTSPLDPQPAGGVDGAAGSRPAPPQAPPPGGSTFGHGAR